MLYELRHDDLSSSRALDALSGEFTRHTLPIWARLGIEPVGFWSVVIGSHAPGMTYMLAWESLAQRETLWEQFEADPEHRRARAAQNARPGGDPVRATTNTILRPTPFSHLPRQHNQPRRLEGGLYELRTYAFDAEEPLQQTLAWFDTGGKAFMEAHGMFAMGFWTTVIGVAPRLTYMLVFEDLAHRERAWANFYTDPRWPALQDGLYPGGQSLLRSVESRVMKGTEFSGWR